MKIFVFSFTIAFQALSALPQSPILQRGDANFVLNEESLIVTASNGAIIEWDSFSIQENECARFIQPDVQSVVLNRIISQHPSEIFGRLEANGQLLLVNPNGVIFGKEARIDVGNLIASTLEIQNDELIGKNWVFSGNSQAGICQMGQIHANDLFFIAKRVDQIGIIEAAGTVGIGLGKEVWVYPDANHKISVSIGDEGASFFQTGNISGKIFFAAPLGEAIVSGTMRGDEIRIGAEVLRVEDGAKLDSLLIHLGEKEGLVKRLYCSPLTAFHADGADIGNGGEILFWAKEDARFYGLATARGGKLGGNGGHIELSSPGTVEYKGRVDTLAPKGRTGHFLLDPSTINITIAGPSVPAFANPYNPIAAIANLDVADLNAALMASSVTIQTSSGVGGTGDINVMPFAAINVDPLNVGNIQLFLFADNDLNIQESITAAGTCSIGPQFDFRANANATGTTGLLKIGYSGQISNILVGTTDGRIDLSGTSIEVGDTNVGAGVTARVLAQGANGTMNINSAGDFSIIGTDIGGGGPPQASVESSQAMILNSGANCKITAGIATQASVLLSSGGTLTMVVGGDLSLVGGGTLVNSGSQATIDSALTQNIRVLGNILLQGGNGSNTDVTIQTSGSQTIDCSGLIELNGGISYPGINGTKAQILSLTGGLNQEIRGNRLHMTGGEDVNSDCIIRSNGPQATLIAQDIVMQAGAGGDPSVNGTNVTIETLNGGDQIINAGLLSLTTGFCINSSAKILSTGDQRITCTGPITLSGVSGSSTLAMISCEAVQTISGTSLTLTGATQIIITMPGAQIFNIGGDVLLQALPMLGGGIATTNGLNNPQTANIGGSLTIIGDVGASMSFENGTNSFMDVGGDITLLGNGGSVLFNADSGNDVILVGGNLLIDSTTGIDAHLSQDTNIQLIVSGSTVIGTATSQGTQTLEVEDDAFIAIQGNLTVEGGSGAGASSRIEQLNSFTGVFTMLVGEDGTLLGGTGSDAEALIEVASNAEISFGNNLFVTGGSGIGAFAEIETGFGYQQVFVGRSIHLTGGTSLGGGAYAGIVNFLGDQQVSSGQDIFLNAGSGAATNHAILGAGWFDTFLILGFTTPDFASSQVSAYGSILSQNNASGSRAYFDLFASGIIAFDFFPILKNGALTIQSAADISMASSFAATENAFTTIQDFIYINSDQDFAAGLAWPANGHAFLAGTPLAAASPAQAPNGLGGFRVSTGPIGGPISLTSQQGDIYLSSAERFISGILDNLTIGPGNNELTLNSFIGDISVDPFHNIYVTNAVTTGGDVFMIAQNDISFTSTGSIAAGGSVILVCDNQFPAPPLLGPGAFSMEPGSSITTGTVKGGGPLQIFTSRRSQNSILGTLNLNGATFEPGDFLIDSSTEHWCVYYPDLFYGGVYTVFYKECLGVLTAQATIINSEFALDLHPVDEHLGREERFLISYDIYQDTFFNEFYQIRRRKLNLFNYPNESTAVFW